MSAHILCTFKSRKMEWWYAFITLGFGIWLSFPQDAMATRAYTQLVGWMPEDDWAKMFGLTGLIHLLALYINGSRWWTPLLRFTVLVINALAYAVISAGFWAFYWPTTATYTYAAISIGGMVCVYAAAWDATHAVRVAYSALRAYYAD